VEFVTREQETQQVGASGKRKASSKAGVVPQEEEAHAALAYVVRQLNGQLFTEFMQCLYAHQAGPWADAGEISDANADDAMMI
jgi:hypothetical protein